MGNHYLSTGCTVMWTIYYNFIIILLLTVVILGKRMLKMELPSKQRLIFNYSYCRGLFSIRTRGGTRLEVIQSQSCEG